ncbi:uncharacterized protein MONBRDRAFT_6714 [Monosiga brevicollis MX1]|uniref:Nuclear speckle splicing regulatory protein 1 N-terminal domain-containing protein n=1 Tax=Monosiga brevicollis TaxID=81824 RepID=A9UV32_MONBE|nr:uncharacterized protein MONBRDRAFT_6714 [Monosiga brevicollis MX1]EDQ91011.1 predicted protein [Monosiga brevicollis MX1]|eukprot:XP_001744308.1 hypothetical protein [Monosiga brevicollis MX1]
MSNAPAGFGLTFAKRKPLTAAQRAEKFNSLRSNEVASVFGHDDSDDEQQDQEAQRDVEKALEEDDTIFDYDEVYDSMNQERMRNDPRFERFKEKKEKPKAKYINALMKSAAERKMVDELRRERVAQKERDQEDGEFADKEEFVTEAFKKKLLELREFEAREKAEEEAEARNAVTKKGDLNSFYRTVLAQNDATTSAVSKAASDKLDASARADRDAADKAAQAQTAEQAEAYEQRRAQRDQLKSRRERIQRQTEQMRAETAKRDQTQREEEAAMSEELKAKYARQTSEDQVDEARARALARRRQRKRPERMED